MKKTITIGAETSTLVVNDEFEYDEDCEYYDVDDGYSQ